MFQDKITLRIHTAYKKITADHGISYREKCRRARETIAQIYRDEELCITENLIKRADFLRSWKNLFYKDRFYTRLYELDLIHTLLENMIFSGHVDSVSTTIYRYPSVASAETSLLRTTISQQSQMQSVPSSSSEPVPAAQIQPENIGAFPSLTIASQEIQESQTLSYTQR